MKPGAANCVTQNLATLEGVKPMQNNLERFEAKFQKSDGCWLWRAGVDKSGYGRFRIGQNKVRAHRASYEFYKSSIPADMVVRHACDNPRCVNPEHLLIGTHKDNTQDAIDRGRFAKGKAVLGNRRSYAGSAHPGAKLTEEMARKAFDDSRTHALIASELGVTRAAISHLKRGVTWSHLALNYPRLSHA